MKLTALILATLSNKAESKPSKAQGACADGIYPVVGECNAFYKCANGVEYPKQYCPENLLFNGEVCDYPENVTCKEVCADGIYPVPDECNAFVLCANGIEFPKQYCPLDLLFNGEVCDWPANVNCNRSAEEMSSFGRADCEDGVHAHPRKCNAYYQCANGIRYPTQYCPKGLLFNGEVCDHPENVDCDREGKKKECEDGIHAHPRKCNAYYQCANGQRYPTQYCPKGLLFNGEVCDHAENVDCDRDTKKKECEDGVHAHPRKCNAYYQCANGVRYPTQFCPDNLLFNGEVCDHPENVDCDKNDKKKPCEDGVHAHPRKCNAYYQCANGIRYPTQYCPDNLLFNGEVCDHPENVDCNATFTFGECPEPHGMFPVDGECNAFYQCAYGERFPNQYCPDGLVFNGVDQCDYPQNVDCERSILRN